MYVGDKGFLLAGFNGDNPRVLPPRPEGQAGGQSASNATQAASQRQEGQATGQQAPSQAPVRRDGAIDAWIAACKGGPPSQVNFEMQAPVTEALLLGCLAQRLPGEKLL